MSFVEAFYTFSIEIVDPDHQRYANVRLKVPKHPFESLPTLYARILTYALFYEKELILSQGLYAPDEPAVWKKDLLGNIVIWIDVGEVDFKRLRLAARHAGHQNQQKSQFKVVFFHPLQISSFCTHLRGSKTNWIEDMQFFLLEPALLDNLAEDPSVRTCWSLTVTDGTIYLSSNEKEFAASFTSLNIWDEYQKHLLEHATTEADSN